MAALELNEEWDSWAAVLSDSHESTLLLLEAGKMAQAHAEFRDHFVATVGELHGRAAVTPPERFARIADWQAWVRHLHALTIIAERSLRADDASTERARAALDSLRSHFYRLHLETDTRKSNDFVYAVQLELTRDQPDARAIGALRNQVAQAPPCRKALAEPDTYQQARSAWAHRIDIALKDEAITPPELEDLRSATRMFHRDFGNQLD